MRIVAQFNPLTAMSGSFNASGLQIGSKMLVINKSYVDLKLAFSNGFVGTIIANDRRIFCFTDKTGVPNATMLWSITNIDNPQTVNQLSNLVTIEVFDVNENVPETYPTTIQRQPTPNIIPYNVGFGTVSTGVVTPVSSGTRVIWPSSYVGLTVAPSAIGGLNYDHFYYTYNPSINANWIDLPGQGYPTQTGKTPANLTLSAGTTSFVPGPFSLGGLRPVDSGVFFNQAYFSFPATIPWASSTNGFKVELFVYHFGSTGFQNLFGDGNGFSNGGIYINIDPNNNLGVDVDFAGGAAFLTYTGFMPNKWHQIIVQYTGTTTNTCNLWVDGVLVSFATVSGAPVNSTNVPRLGSNTNYGGTFTGYMANVGIQLAGGGSGIGSPLARWLLAQQSLNQDYQMGWIDKWEVTALAATTSQVVYSFNNLFNPAGLLNINTEAQIDPLHTFSGGKSITYPVPNGVIYDRQMQLPNRWTSFASSFYTFIYFGEWITGQPQYVLQVHGYNLLGIL